MRLKLLVAGLVVLLAACGTEKEPQQPIEEQPPVEQDPGLVKDANGNAVEYPPAPYGARVGDVVRNFSLYGYKSGVGASDYKEVKLSDFYNPGGTGGGSKALWVNVAAGWCGPCRQEMPHMVQKCADKAPQGLACYTAIMDDNQYNPATREFIEGWGNQYKIKHALVLDTQPKWGFYFDKAATPMNMLVDLRTMKILYLGTGYDAQAIEDGIAAALK